MRTRLPLLLSAIALSGITVANDQPTEHGDTLRDQAVTFLEKHLNDLRDIHTRSQAFTSAFLDESARHPCDICKDRTASVDVSKYAFEAEQAFPERFDFTQEIHREDITVWKLDKSEYRFTIPYTKHIPASPLGKKGGNRPDLGKPSTVELIATVKYINGRWGMENVERVPRPTNVLMLELAPMLAMGSPKFDDQKGFTPDVSGTVIKAGVVYYFNPLSQMNKGEVWLKTGLRVAMRTTELKSGDLDYDRLGVVHSPAIGADGLVVDDHSTINVRSRASNINETVRSTAIEVPLGISKRIALSSAMDLSLEAEVSYSLVLARSIDGDYELESTGTDHVINGETMNASGGANAEYTAAPAAVRDRNTGGIIDFFTGRTSLLDGLALDKSGYLSFGFLPSVFIRKNGNIKYNIGLRFQMVGNPQEDRVLGADYFLDEDDTDRPALSTLTNSAYQTFIGLTLGLSL
jgi:hypothetical protein